MENNFHYRKKLGVFIYKRGKIIIELAWVPLSIKMDYGKKNDFCFETNF